jgi:HEAT repeat protein
MRSAARALLLTAWTSAAAACITPRAQIRRTADHGDIAAALRMYRSHVQERGAPNPDALADVALVVMRRAASSDDPRDRAAGFAALRSIGPRARDVYNALSDRPGAVGDRATAALYELDGREGPPPARLTFAAGTSDPERIVAGLVALDARRDVNGLVRALTTEWPEVRRAAAQRLGRMRADAAVAHALAEGALHDADAMVRAACVMSLAGQGPGGVDAIAHALDDPDIVVRLVAIWSLAQAVPSEARERLSRFFEPGSDPMLAIEAARALATHSDAAAIEYILGALDDARDDVRAQAAVAAAALPDRVMDRLAPHIEDADVEVRIRIAGRFAGRDAYRARVIRAMRPIAMRPDPIVAVRALQVLAEAGDPEAAGPLRGALASRDDTVKRIAVLAWSHLAGSSGEADPLAPLLEDRDRSIRLMAAAEIVRIASR